MHQREPSAAKLGDAANIAGGNQIGPCSSQVAELALAQSAGNRRLQHVVGTGGAATDVNSASSTTVKPARCSSVLGSAVILWPCCRLQAEW